VCSASRKLQRAVKNRPYDSLQAIFEKPLILLRCHFEFAMYDVENIHRR